MIIPVISFVLGIVILVYILLDYFNSPLLNYLFTRLKIKENPLLGLGLGIISLTLMLGLIGSQHYVNSSTLRSIRVFLSIIGFLLIFSQLSSSKNNQLSTILNVRNILKSIAIALVLCLLIKSVIFVDWNGDTWMYQLPFAARMWNLVPEKYYLMEHERELLYEGFPKLANFFQGLFWSMAGINNPQFTNLTSFLSLLLYLFFLKSYLEVPFYISSVSLLAVPLIHIASTASYVDLMGNVGVAILILMTYLLYLKKDFITWKNFIIFTLAGSLAANTKFLLVPPILIIFGLAIARVLFLAIKKSWINPAKIILFLLTSSFSAIIIFATEVRNLVVYGNPFYPLRISIAGTILNHTVTPSSDYLSPRLQAMLPLQRWVYSLLEIGAFDERRPWPWTIAMDFVPLDSDTFGMGGYFAAYVIFNLVVLGILCRRFSRESNLALVLIICLSIITAMLPFSYQLRYYMYWIMVLISLNLFLITKEMGAKIQGNFMTLSNFALVATVFLIIFGILTRWDYTKPTSNSLSRHRTNWLNYSIVQELKDDEKYCLVGMSPKTFLYNAKFHPPHNYSIQAEFMISPEYVKEQCGSRKIIAPDDIKAQLNKNLNLTTNK